MVDQAAPRKAATVVVLREGTAGPEALLLRRHSGSGFAADAWVFPGGVVDVADRTLGSARWRGVDPQGLAGRFGEPREVVLGLHVAAARETFEEPGCCSPRLLAAARWTSPTRP
jgi:8-oxo-dGTP pyrophosphatase MutT (NUDIX family)